MGKSLTNSFAFLLLMSIYNPAFSQKGLEIVSGYDLQKNFQLQCYNYESCDYIVYFNISSIPFDPGDKNIMTVHPGKNLIYSTPGIYAAIRGNAKYSFTYVKGRLRPKINTKIIYLMPLKGTDIPVLKIPNLDTFISNINYLDWYCLEFKGIEGDTVFASRAGTVSEIHKKDELQDAFSVYSGSTTYVEIFHEDGSFANYCLLKSDTFFVRKGQRVLPGSPIGLIDGSHGASSLAMSVYYVDYNKVDFSKPSDMQIWYATIKPRFYTETGIKEDFTVNQTCTSSYPLEIKCQELSKREKKRLLKK